MYEYSRKPFWWNPRRCYQVTALSNFYPFLLVTLFVTEKKAIHVFPFLTISSTFVNKILYDISYFITNTLAYTEKIHE